MTGGDEDDQHISALPQLPYMEEVVLTEVPA